MYVKVSCTGSYFVSLGIFFFLNLYICTLILSYSRHSKNGHFGGDHGRDYKSGFMIK